MLLGRSSEGNDALDLNGTVRNEVDSGVEHGEVLLRYADAAVGRTPDLGESRDALNVAMGPAPSWIAPQRSRTSSAWCGSPTAVAFPWIRSQGESQRSGETA